jgi:hypothetical protein
MPQISAALRAAVHDFMVGMLWRGTALCPLCVARAAGVGRDLFCDVSRMKLTETAHRCVNSV